MEAIAMDIEKTSTTLGADPEFFIEDLNGIPKSIIGMIGGTKEEPRIIDDFGDFKIQEDNVAAEYNIPASWTKQKFIDHILWPQKVISKLIGTDKYRICTKASMSFPKEELLNPKAQEFGCDPDYNAWTLNVNKKPNCKDKTFRTAGGHIHIGTEDKSIENTIRIIRNMDKFVGVWSVLSDADKKRKLLYGKAGAFREQPHGCEYRTLSNFWIFDEILIGEVWDRTQTAVGHPNTIEPNSKEAKLIQYIINKNDIEKAISFLKQHKIL
jgi:hypothetical protein